MQANIVVSQIINFAHLYLPGFDYIFGWILLAVCRFIIGSIFAKKHSKD